MSGDTRSATAVSAAAEVFLQRKLFKRRSDDAIIRAEFTTLHYPCYWHYDILFALHVLKEAGCISDERCSDALDLLEAKQLPQGGWPAEATYWRITSQDVSGKSAPSMAVRSVATSAPNPGANDDTP